MNTAANARARRASRHPNAVTRWHSNLSALRTAQWPCTPRPTMWQRYTALGLERATRRPQ